MNKYYQILDLDEKASKEEIEKKYNKLSDELDPKKNDNLDFFKEEHAKVQEAYKYIIKNFKDKKSNFGSVNNQSSSQKEDNIKSEDSFHSQKDEESSKRKEKSNRVILLLGFVVVLLCIVFFFKINQSKEDDYSRFENTVDLPLKKEQLKTLETKNHVSIIIGSFGYKSNAKKQQNILLNEGFNNIDITQIKSLYRVSVKVYGTKEKIKEIHNKIKLFQKDAWVSYKK